MKAYQIKIEEILQKVVEVRAKSKDEAIEKVKDKYKKCIYVLDYEDFKEVNFSNYKKDES